MVLRSKKEAEAGLIEDSARLRGWHVELRSERLQDISRTALRGEGAVAVLDDRQAARGRDDPRSRRDIDRPR